MIDLFWLGNATETTAQVCLRSTVNGQISLTVSEITQTGSTVDTTVADGVGSVTATGLNPNSKYNYTVTVGGDSKSGVLKTMPGTGDSFTFMWGSCIEQGNFDLMPSLKKLLDKYDPAIFMFQGDMYYPETGKGFGNRSWGGNTPTIFSSANRTDKDNAYTAIRMSLHNPYVKELMQSQPFYWMWDDHEMYNDFCLYTPVGGFPTTPDVTYPQYAASMVEFYQTYNHAVRDYLVGNPINTDAGIDADPLYPAAYWRKTIGNIEFFQPDVISYRNAFGDVESINKRMLGTTQESWMSGLVSSSIADFKILGLGKAFFQPQGTGNADSYDKYSTERDRLVEDFGNVTTCAVITGDLHNPHANYAAPDADTGGTYGYTGKLLDVVASPMASTPFHAAKGTTNEDDYIRWVSKSPNNNYYDKYCCVGLGEYDAATNKVTLSILAMDGTKLVSYVLGAGDNQPENIKI